MYSSTTQAGYRAPANLLITLIIRWDFAAYSFIKPINVWVVQPANMYAHQVRSGFWIQQRMESLGNIYLRNVHSVANALNIARQKP